MVSYKLYKTHSDIAANRTITERQTGPGCTDPPIQISPSFRGLIAGRRRAGRKSRFAKLIGWELYGAIKLHSNN